MSIMEATERMQYLTFQLAGEEYALGILRVREIIQWQEVTRVPTAPPAIRGVLNLRGSVVPVVDLGLKFGLGATEPTRRTCIVIVEVEREDGQTVMGIVADAVSQVMDLGEGDIEPPPSFGTRMRVEFLEGMARMGDRFALVLDVDRLLSTAELLAMEQAGAEAPDAGEPAAAE